MFTSLRLKYDLFKVSYNIHNKYWKSQCMQEERLRREKIKSENLTSHQVSEKVSKEKSATKQKGIKH